jgi:lysophospholipase
VRYALYRALRREYPELGVGAPSYGWSFVALDVKRHILKKGAPEKVSTPVLIFSAKYDHLVEPLAQQEFSRRVKNGEWREIPCKHELYYTPDEYFHPYMGEILSYFGG